MRRDVIKTPLVFFTAQQRRLSKAVLAVVALAAAASLLGWAMIPAAAEVKARATKLTEGEKIIHLLNRIGYGPRPGDVERLKRMGVNKYIDQQLHPERINDSATEARLTDLYSLHMPVTKVLENYPDAGMVARELGLDRKGRGNGRAKSKGPNGGQGSSQAEDREAKQDHREVRQQIAAYYADHGLKPPQRLLQELQAQKLIRAVYSERQLQEVMTDFWFNHFNIFWGKGGDKWLTTDFEMNAIRPHTLGKFKDLLMATAKSPAMLFYLDNYLSSSPDAKMPERRRMDQRGRFPRRPGPFGVIFDNPRYDSQPRAQAANQQKNRKSGINENYARELMELHTLGVDGGYTQKDVQEVARCFTGWSIDKPRQNGRFIFRERMHDNGEKMVLGHKIRAGGGIKDGEKVIDILVHHPSTAKFISTKLVRRFVSDNPPPSLVDQVAAVYMKTDGDLREMLRTILTSPEFYSPEAHRAKIKSPFELAVSAIRALGGDTNGAPPLAQFVAKMGEPLYQYQPPTGYPDCAEQWVNTGALLERLNFGLALSTNRVPGTAVDLNRTTVGLDGAQADRIMDRAIAVLLSGDVSPQTRAILKKQLQEGVPVKGELGDDPITAMRRGDARDDGDATMADAGRARPNGKAARQERRAVRDWDMGSTVASADPQTAQVFGLVLGSPEFQRR